MDDKAIVDLYWLRNEEAITQTDKKYGAYCNTVAKNVGMDPEDSAECVNDTYLAAWNAMPTYRPSTLAPFLGKLTRRIAIDRWRKAGAKKRGGGQGALALEELAECVLETAEVESIVIRREAVAALNRFLDRLSQTERQVFLCRYFYLDPVADISRNFRFSEAKTAAMLRRTRLKLREALEKEGYL